MTATEAARLTFGSLFAGIGGFDLGFERASMVCKWQVEIDDYATKVLEKHWPHVHRERDIRQCGKHNLEAVDVISFGSPCQDISIGNTGVADGILGSRSGLFFEAVRIINEIRPRVSVMENVPAITGRGLDRVLSAVAEIGCDAEWFCVPCRAAGLCHKRERFFLIAYPCGTRWKRPESHDCLFDPKKTTYSVSRHRTIDTWSSLVRGGGTRRSGDGVSVAMDRHRLRGLGNAVVPQVSQWIGQRIVEAMQ